MANNNGKSVKKKVAKKKRRKRLAPVKKEHKSVTRARNEEAIKKLAIVFGAFIVILIIILFVLGLGALVLDRRQEKSEETTQAVAQVEAESLPEPEEQDTHFLDPENPEDAKRIEELTVFYQDVLSGFINVMVLEGKFYVSEVNQRIKVLNSQIVARFGKGALINPVWNYHPRGTSKINAQATIRKDGTPLCTLFIAAIKERYDKLQATGATGWQTAFFNFLIVNIEHELEHLAISRFPEFDSDSTPLTIEESVRGEALIWHNTCLYVVSVLAEDDSQPLDSKLLLLYNAWDDGGRQPDSQSWLAYVRHNLVDHKRNKER